MAEIELVVNGMRFGGWKAARVTRSIESLAGSFALEVTDRWGDAAEPRAIQDEDACRVEVDGVPVIDGYVDKPSISATKDGRSLSYTGRDRVAALVDNSALLAKWTWRDVNIRDFATAVAAPFGIRVSVQAGLELAKVRKLVISPGDTGYEAIRRAAADQGMLCVSDGAGGVILTRASNARATALLEGVNIVAASFDRDNTDRYHRYVMPTHSAAADEGGGGMRVWAEAIDEGVRRTDRVLLIRPDKGYDIADARRRVDWEARVRAARAEAVVVTVRGWRQPTGALWPINVLTYVQAPQLVGVDGDMRVSQVEYSISEAGQLTTLRLVRPDAFTPEPKARVKAGGGGWKELAKGGL